MPMAGRSVIELLRVSKRLGLDGTANSSMADFLLPCQCGRQTPVSVAAGRTSGPL